MKAMGQGQVVIVSSLEAYLPFAEHALYTSSKAALLNLSESFRVLLLPYDICVTVITPGFVRPQMTRLMKREGGGTPEVGWTTARMAGRVFADSVERGDPWISCWTRYF